MPINLHSACLRKVFNAKLFSNNSLKIQCLTNNNNNNYKKCLLAIPSYCVAEPEPLLTYFGSGSISIPSKGSDQNKDNNGF